jgi:TonB family protein
MIRKNIAALLPLLLVSGASLAQETPPASNPPAQPPLMLGGAEPLTSKQKEVLDLLLARKWKEAQETAKLQLAALAGYVDEDPRLAASALALEALADAGAGDKGPALCRWKVALSLDPKLARANLSAFGAAGELLRGSLSVPAEQPKATPKETPLAVAGEVSRPEILSNFPPLYPEAARQARVEGKVSVESIIGKDGSVTNARILQDQPMGLGLSALEAICGWRFKPAMMKGEPVKVYYVVTVNFSLQKAPPPATSNP